MENEIIERKYKKAMFTTIGALILLVASAGYIVFRMMSNKAYNEKWKDYNECGLA